MKNSDFVFKGKKYNPLMHLFVPLVVESLMIIIYLSFMKLPIINLWPKEIGPEFLNQFDRVRWDIFGVVFISFFLSLALADYINGKATRPRITLPWIIPAAIVFLYTVYVVICHYNIGEELGDLAKPIAWLCFFMALILTTAVSKKITEIYLLTMLIVATFIIGLLPALFVMMPLALVRSLVITLKWLSQKKEKKFNHEQKSRIKN